MKKIVFAVDKGSFNFADHAGVRIKVHSQIERMRNAGHTVSLYEYERENGYPVIRVESDTDYLYFRRIETSLKLLASLYKIKKAAKGIKIIMEIPTYPFKGEQREEYSIKRKISIWFGTTFLRLFVNRIVLSGQIEKIKKLYGIPVIHIDNGVDFNQIKVNKAENHPGEDIHMVCVSGCMLSHGYDRMIKGMEDYYSKTINPRNIYFHVVGVGEQLEYYKELAESNEILKKRVIFYGRKIGGELDKVYEQCNLAIAHLATHRIGVKQLSSLKSCEYAARGIPMVSSASLGMVDEESRKYILYVPEDESNICIEDIIEFYDCVYGAEGVHNKMRNAFLEKCDWKYTFIPVMEYIQGER